jgi:hypothetical protein
MKKSLLIVSLFLAGLNLFAQDCSKFIFMKQGRIMEMTTYNSDGKIMHKVIETVTSVTTSGGTTTANVTAQNLDQNDKLRTNVNISFKCDNGTLQVDASAMMPQQSNFQFSSAIMSYPSTLTVGQNFPGTSMTMTMNMGNRTMTSKVDITDRTVVDKESLTTPAGTWECYKMTYKLTTTMQGMNAPPSTTTATEWYVPGYAVIQWQMGAMVRKLTAVRD